MKKKNAIFQIYVICLLGCIFLFSFINGIVYYAIKCGYQSPLNMDEFRDMKIQEEIAGEFCKGENTWRYCVAKKMIKEPYFTMYEIIWKDISCFPVKKEPKKLFAYENTWGEERNYGGKRSHEGCDIMAKTNQRGYYEIVSVTDGVVEKMGWLDKGGYRVGIRTEAGAYFYYAHLYEYDHNLWIGKKIKAGDVIGTMGDSGYGEEGTIGKFPVHLHFGIYLDINGEETSVNPFGILKYLEKR